MSQCVPVDAELHYRAHHCVEALPNGRELAVESLRGKHGKTRL